METKRVDRVGLVDIIVRYLHKDKGSCEETYCLFHLWMDGIQLSRMARACHRESIPIRH